MNALWPLTLIFLDLGYLKKIGEKFDIWIDYHKLSIFMTNHHFLCAENTFLYTAPPFQAEPPSRDQAERKSRYDKFVAALRKENIIVREGRCQLIGNEFFQKGVDTLMTMDLASIPVKYPHIRQIIVVACDTDFVPVLNELRSSGIRVHLFYYSDFIRGSMFSMSNEMEKATDTYTLLTKHQIESCRRKKKR
ncbi:MAG: NYN domain-containing protein [Candidatus Woesearchaeota archaeon]